MNDILATVLHTRMVEAMLFAYSQKGINFATSIGDRWNESDLAKEKHLFA